MQHTPLPPITDVFRTNVTDREVFLVVFANGFNLLCHRQYVGHQLAARGQCLDVPDDPPGGWHGVPTSRPTLPEVWLWHRIDGTTSCVHRAPSTAEIGGGGMYAVIAVDHVWTDEDGQRRIETEWRP